jgi:hypothetical protein
VLWDFRRICATFSGLYSSAYRPGVFSFLTSANDDRFDATVYLLRPSEDREELDKLLHTSDVISMRLFSLEFDSKLLMMSACSIWLHSVTRLEYAIDPDLFCV